VHLVFANRIESTPNEWMDGIGRRSSDSVSSGELFFTWKFWESPERGTRKWTVSGTLSLSLSLSLSCARARAHSRINRKTEAISRAAVANWPRLTRTFVLLCSDNISPLLPLPPSSIPVSLLHRCGMSGPPASSPEASRFSCAPSSS